MEEHSVKLGFVVAKPAVEKPLLGQRGEAEDLGGSLQCPRVGRGVLGRVCAMQMLADHFDVAKFPRVGVYECNGVNSVPSESQ